MGKTSLLPAVWQQGTAPIPDQRKLGDRARKDELVV